MNSSRRGDVTPTTTSARATAEPLPLAARREVDATAPDEVLTATG